MSDSVEKDKQLQIYVGDRLVCDGKNVKREIGYTFSIAYLERLSFEEFLQETIEKAYEKQSHLYPEDKPRIFLYWCNGVLFDRGSFEWSKNEEKSELYMTYFFYTPMKSYQETISKTVFDSIYKFNIIKTDQFMYRLITENLLKDEITNSSEV